MAGQPGEGASLPQSASNESVPLVPGAQAAAARAHHLIQHLIDVGKAIQADIERYVPPSVIQAAEGEAAAFLRDAL